MIIMEVSLTRLHLCVCFFFQIYNPITRQVTRNLSRFREAAYGGSFRSDGKLVVAGGEENLVRLFDVQSKSLLRLFTGHTAPVRLFSITG